MNKKVIISVIGSLAIHGGFLWGGDLFKSHKEPPKKEEPPQTMEVLAMPPPMEEEPVDVTPEPSEVAADISDLAPPSQTDVPSAAVDSAFVQQVQPPPPPHFKGGAITIPTGPTTARVGSGINSVFDIANLDQRPEVRYQPAPKFPIALKRAHIGGSVVLQFVVDRTGEVRDAVVIKSTHREFEAPAVEAVTKWKFRPGKKGNAEVSTRMQAEVEFALTKES